MFEIPTRLPHVLKTVNPSISRVEAFAAEPCLRTILLMLTASVAAAVIGPIVGEGSTPGIAPDKTKILN